MSTVNCKGEQMTGARKTTAELELNGSFKKHPERARGRPVDPPKVGKPGAAPKDWPAPLKQAWRDILKYSPPGVLCASDRLSVEAGARALAEMRTGDLKAIQEWRQWVAKFGMTPRDRASVAVAQAPAAAPTASPFTRPGAETIAEANPEPASEERPAVPVPVPAVAPGRAGRFANIH